MNEDFVLCARAAEKNKFIAEPGPTLFLQESKVHFPSHQQSKQRIGVATFYQELHIGNTTFAKDLCETLKGNLDRSVVFTRTLDGDGQL